MGERTWIPVLVALGSNVGRRRAQLDSAVDALRTAPAVRVERVSAWIATDPVGGPAGQRAYWNGVLAATTQLTPEAFLELLLAIEARHGRERVPGEQNAPRCLDLDLLVHGETRRETEGLSLPHPRMEERLFVLEPLAEILPEFVLPRCGSTVQARIAALRSAAREEAGAWVK